MSIRSRYERELDGLKLRLIQMGGDVERAIGKVLDALTGRDGAGAEAVIGGEKGIALQEAFIEKECFNLLLRQQPVARDFREVSAALKIVTELQRIGHQCSDIAELILSFGGGENIRCPAHLPQMAELAIRMVGEAVDAYVHSDAELARRVYDRDDELDGLFLTARGELVELIRADDANVDRGILLLMIAKYFERIGDHAANISDWVSYDRTGRHIDKKYEE